MRGICLRDLIFSIGRRLADKDCVRPYVEQLDRVTAPRSRSPASECQFEDGHGPSIAQATVLLQARRKAVLDPTLFGVGRDVGSGRFQPVTANPKQKPYTSWNPRTRSYQERRLTRADVLRHVTGARPLFLQNVAHLRTNSWDVGHVDAFVATVFADAPTPDGWDESLDAIKAGRFRITPDEVKRLLFANPESPTAKQYVDRLRQGDPLAALKRALVGCGKGTRRNVVARALRRATRTEFDDVRDHEVVVDIDNDPTRADGTAAATAIAEAIASEVPASRGSTLVEPSRNGGGAYVRFRVLRRTDDPRAFNLFLRAFGKWLKQRFNRDGAAAHVCKVGGELTWFEPNAEYDDAAFRSHNRLRVSHAPSLRLTGDMSEYLTDGEAYVWRRGHHGIQTARSSRPVAFSYDPKFEQHVRMHADLITLGLHAVERCGPVEAADRVARYQAMLEAPPIDEADLRRLIPAEFLESDVRQPRRRSGRPTASAVRAVTVTKGTIGPDAAAVPAVSPPPPCRDSVTLFDPAQSKHLRYNAACRIALRAANGSEEAACPIALGLVELPEGPATGPRTAEREAHVRRKVRYASRTFDVARSARGGDARAAVVRSVIPGGLPRLEAVLRTKISAKRLRDANGTEGAVTYEILAVGMEFYVAETLVGRNVSQSEVAKVLGKHGLRRDRATLAALRRCLTDPRNRLLVQVTPASSREGGRRAAGFKLSHRCALKHLFLHVPDLHRHTSYPVRVSPAVEEVYGEIDDAYELQNDWWHEAERNAIASDDDDCRTVPEWRWSSPQQGRCHRARALPRRSYRCGRAGRTELHDNNASVGRTFRRPLVDRRHYRNGPPSTFLTSFC